VTRSKLILARLALALFGLVAGVALLAGIELALWVVGAGEGPPAYDPFHGFSAAVPLFARGQGADGAAVYTVSPARLADTAARGEPEPERTFLAQKPPGGFRVFVVGESSAAGFPYTTDYAFSAWLGRRLRADLSDLPIEVVNAAVAGYSSRRALLVAREIAAHQPDLLIVYSGHNEWAERRYYSRLIEMDPWLFRLRERLIATRLFSVLSHLPFLQPKSHQQALEGFMRDQQQEFSEMFAVFSRRIGGQDYATPQQIAQRDQLYRLNLEEIVRAGRAAGAQVLLMTLSQNFADWAPGASTHRPGLRAEEEARFAWLVAAGERAAAAGDCAAALGSFREALAIDGEYAALHYQVAQCQRALGAFDEARAHYRLASDLDRVPYGAPTRFNDVVREIAGEHGLLLLDVDALMTRESEHGLVGEDLFIEFAHPNLRANQLIGAALAETLRTAGVPLPAERWLDGGYANPTPAALYAANPELRLREHEAIRFVCLLARREACVKEQDAALAKLRAPPG